MTKKSLLPYLPQIVFINSHCERAIFNQGKNVKKLSRQSWHTWLTLTSLNCLETFSAFGDNEHFGIKDSQKCEKNGPAIGDWKDWVCDLGCKSILILYSQTLFDRQQMTEFIPYVKKIGKLQKRLEFCKYQVGDKFFNEARQNWRTNTVHYGWRESLGCCKNYSFSGHFSIYLWYLGISACK